MPDSVSESKVCRVFAAGIVALCVACKSPRENATEAMIAGEQALNQGDLDAAEAAFDRALDNVPQEPKALAGKAAVLLRRGDAIAALKFSTTCTHSACAATTDQAREKGLAALAKASPSVDRARKEIAIHTLVDARCGLAEVIDQLPQLRATEPAVARFTAEALALAVNKLQVRVDDQDGTSIVSGYVLARSTGTAAARQPTCEDAALALGSMTAQIGNLQNAAVPGLAGPRQRQQQARIFWGAFYTARLALATGQSIAAEAESVKVCGLVVEPHWTSLDCPDETTDEELKHVADFPQLVCLWLGGTQLTDAGLEHFAGLPNLTSLYIENTQLTGSGFKHLARLGKLERLTLPDQVTDAGLKHVAGLTNLTVLDLDYTQITGAGLKHLAGLTKLETLGLGSTQVTNAGLRHLAGLTNLQFLRVDNTRVTDSGVKQLKKSLPDCDISMAPQR
ncbi:MAG: hypothetical protein JKY37_20965 [Nannocystaceae bacterium]|nr:hypothetical protein [Nannocystaceae bacterium]